MKLKMPKRTINPTGKQIAAVNKIVESRGNLSISRAMRESEKPYALATAKNPKNLTDSEGYQLLLKKSGLTKELIATSLARDIKAKPKRRVAELNLGADILGMKKGEDKKDLPAPELHLHLHQSPRVIQIIHEAEEKLLETLNEEIKND